MYVCTPHSLTAWFIPSFVRLFGHSSKTCGQPVVKQGVHTPRKFPVKLFDNDSIAEH